MQAQTQKTLQTQPKTDLTNLIMVETEKLFDWIKEFSRVIERQAYHFFEERGHEPGNELADWFRAETELIKPIVVDLREETEKIFIRAEIPGFTAEELKVSVEPNFVILCGVETQTEEKKTEQDTQVIRRFEQFYRVIDLPAKVEPDKTTAFLKNGILELTLSKSAQNEPTNVEVKTV